MISPMLMAQVRADLDLWETPIPWMYLDSQGLVTVGCGTMLPDAKSAGAIAFFHDRTRRAATAAEAEAAWTRLHLGSAVQKAAAPRDKFSAAHYKDATDLRITDATSSSLRDRHVQSDYDSLIAIYPKFDTFPDSAKLALFDMIYNLGPGRIGDRHHRASGLRRYGAMNAEINQGHWLEAAAHSTRHGVAPLRNRMTAEQLRSCAPKTNAHAVVHAAP